MLILTLRSDKPEAEIGLFDDDTKLVYEVWQAHHELAETIHTKLIIMLEHQKKDWSDLAGIICFQGPGSFTGLRIGLSVANAISYSLNIPIVATQSDSWINHGITRLRNNENDQLALPHYGAPVHITLPKK